MGWLLRRLWYVYRSFGCESHYLIWRTDGPRRFGQCMECLAETEGWE